MRPVGRAPIQAERTVESPKHNRLADGEEKATVAGAHCVLCGRGTGREVEKRAVANTPIPQVQQDPATNPTPPAGPNPSSFPPVSRPGLSPGLLPVGLLPVCLLGVSALLRPPSGPKQNPTPSPVSPQGHHLFVGPAPAEHRPCRSSMAERSGGAPPCSRGSRACCPASRSSLRPPALLEIPSSSPTPRHLLQEAFPDPPAHRPSQPALWSPRCRCCKRVPYPQSCCWALCTCPPAHLWAALSSWLPGTGARLPAHSTAFSLIQLSPTVSWAPSSGWGRVKPGLPMSLFTVCPALGKWPPEPSNPRQGTASVSF